MKRRIRAGARLPARLRRAIILCLAAGLMPSILYAADPPKDPSKRKVIIFGIDGMDPKLLDKFVAAGKMPNFKRLISEGSYKPLTSSAPPLSPTAWSTFITGMDPGGHGIFDFVHRKPANMEPYLSMAESQESGWKIEVGSWSIPLASGKIEQLRKGEAFWQLLDKQGVHTTIYKMPANFPPVASGGEALSGMGTPDIRGTPGTFLFFTDDPPPNKEEITGGEVIEIAVENNKVEAEITGPKNIFRRARKESANRRDEDGKPAKPEYENPDAKVPFAVYLDPEEPVAKLVVQNNEIILKQGEWSEWVPISFDFIPHIASISAIGRFYLQEARPKFKLYLSPLQINPDNPAMPISTPSRWSRDLCDNLGYFYTKELPEETKALSGGIFNGEEFWEQSQYVYHEQRRALDHLLDNFHEGLLFFYYSSVDQGCHMLWRYTDPAHPGYVNDPKLADSIQTLYTEMDESLGRILKVVDRETVLIVMSDHGFSPFYWGMNLNSWLLEKGYIKTKPEFRRLKSKYFAGVDWKRTKAYAIGLNGLYINAKGREHKGGADEGSVEGLNEDGTVVPGSEYEKLLDQLEKELLDLRDTRNGKQPVTRLTRTHRDFHGPYVNVGPDAIVGYNYGYRTSWESPLGEFPRDVFVDNKDAWSGDHCIDFAHVPGVLITNQKITLEHPALSDLTVSVLAEFGVARTANMLGADCLAPTDKPWSNLLSGAAGGK